MEGEARQLVQLAAGSEPMLFSLHDLQDPSWGSMVEVPYHFWAVEHPAGRVLVDCGAHPSLISPPQRDAVSRLAEIGVRPADIGHVVLTHLHYDNCGGLGLFPDATVHVQAAEMVFAELPPPYQASAYMRPDWAGVSTWNEVSGEHDLFGDGAIVMFPTPGHTPGHQSVMVRLPGRVVILVGDAAFNPQRMAERRLPGYLWNPDAVVASWQELERRRDLYDAELMFSHYPLADD
jgi:N-acyl homoserine lactone hydrolase